MAQREAERVMRRLVSGGQQPDYLREPTAAELAGLCRSPDRLERVTAEDWRRWRRALFVSLLHSGWSLWETAVTCGEPPALLQSWLSSGGAFARGGQP